MDYGMKLSSVLASAVKSIAGLPPSRLAAGVGGAVGFVLALLLLGSGDSEAAAGNQLIVVGVGAIISAFLASQLAAYLVRVVEQWAGWLDLGQAWRGVVILILAIVSAAVVVGIMMLVS